METETLDISNKGERLVTNFFKYWSIEHLHRYAITFDHIIGKNVVDIACGEGYGSNLLANYAHKVCGIDVSEEAVNNAKSKYVKENLTFIQGSVNAIPIPSKTIDLVVSFETIEHVLFQEEMLSEIVRILKTDGLLIISSPDKKYYSDVPNYQNPFHVKELYLNEFKTIIENYFKYCNFYFQKTFYGSLIFPEENIKRISEFTGDFEGICENNFMCNPVYNICICSNMNLEYLKPSLFGAERILDDKLSEFTKEIARLNSNNKKMQNSFSFVLGYNLLKPARFLRRIFQK